MQKVRKHELCSSYINFEASSVNNIWHQVYDFVLIIIWKPGHIVKWAAKLLISFAVTDLLVDIIVSLLTCWQVFNHKLNVFEIDYARRYVCFSLCYRRFNISNDILQ